jgi:hypothetical protein
MWSLDICLELSPLPFDGAYSTQALNAEQNLVLEISVFLNVVVIYLLFQVVLVC